MTVFVALLRGINVGGKHILPMQEFRELLGALGCESVATYIQSGNAVFRSASDAATLSSDISAKIDAQFGFAPRVHVLPLSDYRAVMTANPFPDAVDTPSFLHVGFLTEAVKNPNLAALAALKSPTERYELGEAAFYLHAPDGIGRSRLAVGVDRCLGVATTGRNWRTVIKVEELAAGIK